MFELSTPKRLTLVAVAIVSLTGAAQANPRPRPVKVNGDAAVESPSSAPKRETRYCINGPETGTILQHRDCRSRAEWLKQGFDPLAKQ
jgi:hypothetical protein